MTISSPIVANHHFRGSGQNGQLGHGLPINEDLPREIVDLSFYRVTNISCYNSGILIWTETNTPDAAPIVSTWSAMVNNELCSDTVFVVEKRKVYALKEVLKMRCEYFHNMFSLEWAEAEAREITIQDVPHATFLQFLHYLYTSNVNIDHEQAIELFMLGERFGPMPFLKWKCTEIIRSKLNTENVAQLLQKASSLFCDHIKSICMEFLVMNYNDVVLSSEKKLLPIKCDALLREIMTEHSLFLKKTSNERKRPIEYL